MYAPSFPVQKIEGNFFRYPLNNRLSNG